MHQVHFFPITLSKKLDPLPDLSKKIFLQNIIITSWIIGILMMPDIFQLFTFSVKSTCNHSFITSTIQDILPVIIYSKFEIAYLKLSAVCEYCLVPQELFIVFSDRFWLFSCSTLRIQLYILLSLLQTPIFFSIIMV
jgi:hypothetical protein